MIVSLRTRSYFQQSRFSSFQRQLSYYGFQRFTQGKIFYSLSTFFSSNDSKSKKFFVGIAKGGYYHSSFIRDKPELAYTIQRIPPNPSANQCAKHIGKTKSINNEKPKQSQQQQEQQTSTVTLSPFTRAIYNGASSMPLSLHSLYLYKYRAAGYHMHK